MAALFTTRIAFLCLGTRNTVRTEWKCGKSDEVRLLGAQPLCWFFWLLDISWTALFPGLLHLQCLIDCSMQKQREKAGGISSHDPQHGWHHGF